VKEIVRWTITVYHADPVQLVWTVEEIVRPSI